MTDRGRRRRIPALGCGTWELRGELCAQDRRRGAEARLPPCRHRAGLRQRGRGRRGHARFRRAARRVFVTTKVRPQLVSRRRAAAIGRGEPEAAAGRRRSTSCSSTGPIRPFRYRESMARARRREAKGPDAPYRRIQFHDCQARRGDARCRPSRSSPTRSSTIPISTRRRLLARSAATASPSPPTARSRSARSSAIR